MVIRVCVELVRQVGRTGEGGGAKCENISSVISSGGWYRYEWSSTKL